MSRANTIFGNTVTPVPTPNSATREGYPAYARDVREDYLQMLLTNTFGNTFYASSKDLISEAKALHEFVIRTYPAFAGKAIIYARNNGYMRTQPIFGLAKLACMNKAEFKKAFDSVIQTPNDLRDFAVILKSVRGSNGGRLVKKVAGNWLAEKLNEYWTIKYGSDEKEGYSLKDLVKIYHPNLGKRSPIFDYVLGKKVEDPEEIPSISWFETLKRSTETKDIVRAITEGKLPHEVASTFAKNSDVWKAIVPNLPIFALLRNLATIERHNAVDVALPYIKSRFDNVESVTKSKILPFRFLEAINHVNDSRIKDYLRMALENSFSNLPDIAGNTTIALDISGSMGGDFIQKASVFAIALAKKTDLSGKFYTFNQYAHEISVSKIDSILTQAQRIFSNGGTDTSAPVCDLIAKRFKTDNIILITDEQQNTGTMLYKKFLEYRDTINKNTKLFIVDVAPYVGSHLVPDKASGVYYIYGWSDQVLEYISMATKGFDTLVKFVDSK